MILKGPESRNRRGRPTAARAAGFNPMWMVHDLRHGWFTNALRGTVYQAIADAILGHGDKKKTLPQLCLKISDKQLLDAIDMMKFDTGETEIRTKR